MVSGVAYLNAHSWISGFSTLMPLPTSRATSPQHTENTMKRAYEQRIREVEHASFTPLIFSASGGMAREATTFYKRLASLLSTKGEQLYSSTMAWLRCLLSFSLLRPAIQSIRGARSSIGHPISNNSAPSDLINSEALLPGSY